MTTSPTMLRGFASRLLISLRHFIQALETNSTEPESCVSWEPRRRATDTVNLRSARPWPYTVPPLSPTDRQHLLGGTWRMDTRITKDEMFMLMAEVAATRSTCLRKKVGVIIVDKEGLGVRFSFGYNGNARGLENQCDTATPGSCGCLHAEVNALLKVTYGEPLTLYTTLSPCVPCAKLILNSSVVRIVYRNQYRDMAGIDLLQSRGIHVCHLPESPDGLALIGESE